MKQKEIIKNCQSCNGAFPHHKGGDLICIEYEEEILCGKCYCIAVIKRMDDQVDDLLDWKEKAKECLCHMLEREKDDFGTTDVRTDWFNDRIRKMAKKLVDY